MPFKFLVNRIFWAFEVHWVYQVFQVFGAFRSFMSSTSFVSFSSFGLLGIMGLLSLFRPLAYFWVNLHSFNYLYYIIAMWIFFCLQILISNYCASLVYFLISMFEKIMNFFSFLLKFQIKYYLLFFATVIFSPYLAIISEHIFDDFEYLLISSAISC